MLTMETNPLCICINESFLETPNSFSFKGYSTYHSGSVNQAGNLILVRKDTPFTPYSLNTDLNALAVRINVEELLTVCSIYLNPNEPIDILKLDNLISQLPQPFFLVGDFNARHLIWHDEKTNSRGKLILDFILKWHLHILNNETPTHYDKRTNSYSHIDLSVCTQEISSDYIWRVYEDRCGSDHYPVLVESLQFTPKTSRRHFNYTKANWSYFLKDTAKIELYDETKTEEINLDIFVSNTLKTAENCIPFSVCIGMKCIVPWWNDDCKKAKKARNKANRIFKKTRSDSDYIEYKRQCAITQRIFRTAQRSSWVSYVSSITKDTPVSKIWKRVHKILGKHIRVHAPTLLVNDVMIYDSKEIAQAFAKNLSNISRGSARKSFLAIKEKKESEPIDFRTDIHYSYNDNFTHEELLSCLSDCANTAPGEDSISFELLKHVHENSYNFLLQLYNTLWVNEHFPNGWNTAIEQLFLKPGKNPLDPNSYRPIALTSCLCKLYEKMINNRLIWELENRGYLSPSQYGYRKLKSTLDPLTILDADIGNAFLSNRYITAVFFDLEKAYDTTWRYLILEELYSANFRGHLPMAIKLFLENRRFKVKVNEEYSEEFIQFEGVPQGNVLSTTLFILAVNRLARQLPSGIQCSLYVDDFAIWFCYSDEYDGQKKLQEAINNVASWTSSHGFKISATKTVAITFTKKRRVPNITLVLDNHPIKFVNHTKFLGLFLDQRMTWRYHINYLRNKCSKALALLKKLSHTKWGSDRATLLYLHKTLVLSVLDYGCHLYASASKSVLRTLDPIHNAGLRMATGAFKSSPVASLYVETGICPLDQRRVEYSLNYYSQVLRMPSKIERLIRNAKVPSYLGPRTFYPFVVRLKIFLSYYNISPLRFITHSINAIPFWTMKRAEICKGMFECSKRALAPTTIRQFFLEHQREHDSSVSIYTDGSKSNNGVGLSVITSDLKEKRKMPPYSSVFSAELGAISLALYKISSLPYKQFTIYTDSQSALNALEAFNPKHPGVRGIQENIHILHRRNIEVSFCWSPGHVGIKGNELADRYAKAAVTDNSAKTNKCYYKDIKSYFNKILNENWNQKWNSVQRNKLRVIKPNIYPWETATQKSRRDEVVLCRLRIGHTRLTHGYLMAKEDPPQCEMCNTNITIKHLLLSCQKYTNLRLKYFGSSPKLEIILGDSLFWVSRLMLFLKEADIFNAM